MKPTKPELSSLELHAVVKELQPLVGGRINQIFQQDKKEFFIQIHVPNGGRQLLRIEVGKLLYKTRHKPTMETPGTFCMQLRKHTDGATITVFEQVDAQRIARVGLKRADHLYHLFIELFSKGNIVLTDDKNTIIALLERQAWQSRELKPGIIYLLPPIETNLFGVNKKDVEEKIKKSKKEKTVAALATELGLGGTYAEELCARSGIDKNTPPSELKKSEHEKLFASLKEMLKEINTPAGFVFDGDTVAPIPLKTQRPKEKTETFNEALDKLLSRSKVERQRDALEAKYQQKIAELQRILGQQEQNLKANEAAIIEKSAKGDFIYQNYQKVKTLLDEVEKLRAKGGWDAVVAELKKVKQIKAVDLKEKKIVLEIR